MSGEPGKDQMSSELLFQDDTIQSHQNHQAQQPVKKQLKIYLMNSVIILKNKVDVNRASPVPY